MVEVYGTKARQINAQDPAHRRAYTWVNAQCKERRKEVEEKKGSKNFQLFLIFSLILSGVCFRFLGQYFFELIDSC